MNRSYAAVVVLLLLLVAFSGFQIWHSYEEGRLARAAAQEARLAAQVRQAEEGNSLGTLVAIQQQTAETLAAYLKKLETAPPVLADGDPVAAAILLSRLPGAELRSLAAQMLAKLPGEATETRLVEMAKTERDRNVQSSALRALREVRSRQLPAIALALLAEGAREERSVAVSVLEEIATPDMAPPLVTALERCRLNDSQDQELARQLVRALGRSGNPEAVPAIARFIAGADQPWYCREGVEALKRCATAASLETVAAVLESMRRFPPDQANDPIKNLLQLLAGLDDPRASEAVRPWLGSDRGEIRDGAVRAALRLRDPLLAASLLEMLSGAEKDENAKRYQWAKQIEEAFRGGYPGLRAGEEGKGWVLLNDEEMKPLLAEREARIRARAEAAARQNGAEVF